MKIRGDASLRYDEIMIPKLKNGSNVIVIKEPTVSSKSLFEMRVNNDSYDGSGEEDVIVPFHILTDMGLEEGEPLLIMPNDLSKHRYGFVYKSIGDKTLKCLNVKNPRRIKYFPMKWDNKNIPEGIDSVITRIEDGVCGCIWKNGSMIIDFDNEQVKTDIEKYGFEEMIRINMMGIESWGNYKFEYFDLDIADTLDVLKLFPKFFKSESDDYKSLKESIYKEEFEIMELIQVRKNTKQMMMRYKDDPDKLDELYKESMKLKYEINSRFTKYDDEFMKGLGVKKDE